jgi:hypothetical protein
MTRLLPISGPSRSDGATAAPPGDAAETAASMPAATSSPTSRAPTPALCAPPCPPITTPRRCPQDSCTTYAMTDTSTGQLVGAVILGIPTHPAVLTSPFPTLEPYTESLEISRVCLLDDIASNGETWACAPVFEHARQVGVRGLVAHSDPTPHRRITPAGTLITTARPRRHHLPGRERRLRGDVRPPAGPSNCRTAPRCTNAQCPSCSPGTEAARASPPGSPRTPAQQLALYDIAHRH